jgi:hypothetical protein
MAACRKNIISECLIGMFLWFQRRQVQCVQALRTCSSFLFFFDGSFQIFGSSPEAQIIVKTVKQNPSYCRNFKGWMMMIERNTNQELSR